MPHYCTRLDILKCLGVTERETKDRRVEEITWVASERNPTNVINGQAGILEGLTNCSGLRASEKGSLLG